MALVSQNYLQSEEFLFELEIVMKYQGGSRLILIALDMIALKDFMKNNQMLQNFIHAYSYLDFEDGSPSFYKKLMKKLTKERNKESSWVFHSILKSAKITKWANALLRKCSNFSDTFLRAPLEVLLKTEARHKFVKCDGQWVSRRSWARYFLPFPERELACAARLCCPQALAPAARHLVKLSKNFMSTWAVSKM